jgi:hypothetical protein
LHPNKAEDFADRALRNVFCGIEPKAGVHFTKVTPTRSSPEFADFILEIATHYPAAKTIHLIVDNLSTHTRKALTDRFGGGRVDGRRHPRLPRPSLTAG